MPIQRDRRHLYFILSLLLIVAGTGTLILTTGLTDRPHRLWPLAIFLLSMLYMYNSSTKRRLSNGVFLGTFVALAAIVNLVAALAEIALVDYWPLYAVAAGLAMVPQGFVRYGEAKPVFLVPAVSIALLGAFLSVFSFGFSSLPFRTFLAHWWPGMFVAAGLVLFVVWLLGRARGAVAAREGVSGDAAGEAALGDAAGEAPTESGKVGEP